MCFIQLEWNMNGNHLDVECMVFGHDDMTCPKRVVDEGKKQIMESNSGFNMLPRR